MGRGRSGRFIELRGFADLIRNGCWLLFGRGVYRASVIVRLDFLGTFRNCMKKSRLHSEDHGVVK